MLTARGWWFLVLVGLVLVAGAVLLPFYTVGPVVVAAALLGWFAVEWALFQVRLNAVVPGLRLTRRVVQGGREVPMVWAGRAFEVRAEVENPSAAGVPFAWLDDRLPQAAERADGDAARAADLRPGSTAVVSYTARCPAAGKVRFEGVRLRVTDPNGFFLHRAFVRDGTEYLVLPPLADDEGKQKGDKRFNTLPPPGIHRLRRPGSGAELLDLRDYRPGDPPKMIAWKASARRDRLITKEFESDVPVRAVLLLDTSQSVRVGPPGKTAVVRLAAVASGVAQASAGNRDLVGLTTFDEAAAKAEAPARTKLHMIRTLRRLAEASALQPTPDGVTAEALTARAYPLAQELYPELMNPRRNRVPFGRLRVPLLDAWWGWLLLVMALWPYLYGAAVFNSPKEVRTPLIEGMAGLTRWLTDKKGVWLAFYFLLLLFIPAAIGGGIITIRAVIQFFSITFGGWAAELRRRKRLAAVFALEDGSGAAGLERLVHDDPTYTRRVVRFLEERQIRMPVPLYDSNGRYKFRSAEKAKVLAGALTRAVSRARDNELYVILADLVELGGAVEPVVRAARVARARHHRVMVIVPWPADVPPPDAAPAPPADDRPKRRRPAADPRPMDLAPLVRATLIRQYHDAYHRLQRNLGRAGATVVRVNDGDPVQLVLDRLDRLRGLRSRR